MPRGEHLKKPKVYRGKCMAADCRNQIRAGNFCNKHYVKAYLDLSLERGYNLGRKWVRRNTLALEVNQLTGIPLIKCLEIVRIMFDTIKDSMKNGEEVIIPGLGIFGVHKLNKYHYGYPAYFWPSKELREMLRSPKRNYTRKSKETP